jgi:hypothetical protein
MIMNRLTKIKRLPWLRISGITFLFISWVSQNYLLEKWRGEKEYLLRAENTKLIEELEVNYFQYELSKEMSKKEKNESLLAHSAFKAILHSLNLMLWQTITLTDSVQEQSELIRRKYQDEKHLYSLYTENKWEELVQYLNGLALSMNIKNSYKKENLSKFNRILENEKNANQLFLFSYIFSSLLLAIDYFITALGKDAGEGDKSANKAPRPT